MIIKDIRIKILKMSQSDLAAALQMSQANYSRLESGKQVITPEAAIKIEKISNGRVTRADLRPDIFCPI